MHIQVCIPNIFRKEFISYGYAKILINLIHEASFHHKLKSFVNMNCPMIPNSRKQRDGKPEK